MTYQIIYSSVSSTPMDAEDLEEILRQAQVNNSKSGITGALVYVNRFFLQILEGERNSVQGLMERISRDVRHDVVTVLQEGDTPVPAFSDWKMAYVSATPEQVAKWAGLSATTRLPEVFTDIRQDPEKAMLVTNSILSVLAGDFASQPGANEPGAA